MTTDRPLRIERFTKSDWADNEPRFYFRVLAANGEIISQSEGYTTREARDDTVALLAGGTFEVEDDDG